MLSKEENERLTRVGPGTPMGELLRRYWHPIAAAAELEESPTKAIRLLGEDLVLYKDLAGEYGLLQRGCAHRLSDLAMGFPEELGLRCAAHGWLYDAAGQCIDQPLEDAPFCDEIKLRSGAVAVKAGLIWGYLGPQPAPLVPDWEPFAWEDGLVQIVFVRLPCNWLQCQENSLDPMDLEWLQAMAEPGRRPDAPPPAPPELEIGFDEFDHGFVYRRAPKPAADETPQWEVGRTCLWPNGLFVGDRRSCRFEWRLPMDDETTLNVIWFIDRVAPGTPPPAQRYFHWYAPIKDGATNELLTSHPLNRNFTVWVHQGTIFDRTREHLVSTDEGVVLLRTKYFSQLDLVADGGEPKSTLRDASKNHRIELPLSTPQLGLAPPSPPPTADAIEFPHLAGQPDDVAAAYRQVIASWNPPPKRRRAPRRKSE